MLFAEKLDELNSKAEKSSSSLSHHLLVVSSPRLNHPTSKLKRNSHHYCLFSSSHLIFSQAIIWLSAMDCPRDLGAVNVPVSGHIRVFQLVKGQRAHEKSHHCSWGNQGDAMEQQRPLDMGKGLLVHSEKSLSIISNFIKNFLLQISSWAQYSPDHTNRWGRGGATVNQHKNQKQGSQCMLHTTNSQSGPGDSPCNNTIV